MSIYRGFSTIGMAKQFRLTDFELVKQDLINNFYIRKGEKLMNPNVGTIIWNVLYEPFTDDLKRVITADITAIAGNDPRLSIDNVIVTEYETGLKIQLELRYLQTNQVNLLNLQFDNQSKTLTTN